jgi:type I restriction enzyme R subunit
LTSASPTHDHTEHAFEAEIVGELTSAGGWIAGHPKDYDAALGLLPGEVAEFLHVTQPKKWAKIVSLSGTEGKAEQSLLKRLTEQLAKRGTVDVLRRGITEKGVAVKLAFFEPEIKLDPAAMELYAKNRLRVARQVRFDPKGGDSVDVVLFVNGIPTATAELKNRWTGQGVHDAIKQYETSRDPKHPLFKHALVHFAVDAELAYMTTRLEKGGTRFLPFNQGSGGAGEPGGAGNPPAAGGGHPTSYLWRQVWRADAWMELLERFVFVEEPKVDPKTGKPPKGARPTVIFPRYHQWDVVRRCVKTARAEGPGRNYLIQHSAGSGKSKEIAWLAHDLSTVHTADHEPVFDKVIVITDRRVLDSQLRKQVLAFEQTAGTVAAIEQDSTELREALFKAGVRVIITTLQKFPFVLKQLDGDTGLKDSRYAVIVDEAHSSQTGESAVDLKKALGSKAVEDLDLDPDEMDVPPLMLAHLAARGRQPNLSFFAFTATPKAKTLELFGERSEDGGNARAFHTYSMRQAIDEGFILDVLRNYTSYEQLYRLADKADQEIEVPKGKAQSKLRRFATFHPYAKDQKAAVIVEHFRDTVRPHLGGQGKAMVVTAGREEAVRYKQAIDRYVSKESYDGVNSLVAFSGEVKITDPDAGDFREEYREGQMNKASAGHAVADIPGEFDKPEYGVLIVAEKFQTGFDQPKLVGMYVDKPLSGVNAVQTLSRLNRIHPGKTETYIVDFVNAPDDIHAAFEPYYERTEAIPTEPNVLFDAAQKVKDADVITDNDLDRFDQVFYGPDVKHSDLSTLTQAALDRANTLDDADLEEFKADIDRFVRFYAFLSQVLRYVPPATERLYRFSHLLRDRFDSAPDGGAVNLAGQIDLTHFRLEELGTENISLRGDEPDPLSAIRGNGTGSAIAPKDVPMGLLGELVELFNERFGADLTDADALRPLLQVGDVIAEENPHFRDQALSNSEEDFVAGKEDIVTDAMFKVSDVNDAVLKQSLNDDELLGRISAFLMKALYQSYNADTAS